ncbi:MAG: hypothetical protein HRU32_08325 [Rhodobacteraceae bacterium]|nr:hypothetical protein [Paracoccaceae bacterium]
MPLALLPMFEDQALAYGEGRTEDIVAWYDVPLAVYHGPDILIYDTLDDVQTLIDQMMHVASRHGTEWIRPEILGTGKKESGRLPIRVQWHYFDAADAKITISEAVYFCRMRAHARLLIEMVEFVKPAFPDSMQDAPESLWTL